MAEDQEPKREVNAGEYNEINLRDNATYVKGSYYDMRRQSTEAPVQRDNVEGLLLKAVGSEVESRLEQSLHNRIYITLDKQQDPTQVQRPWDVKLKTGKGELEQLPTGTKIETIFDRPDINGRLLILGVPGSGKTTTLLELAKALVARAKINPKHPVPVLLNLSSWKDDKQGIADWIAVALKPKYGLRVDIGKQFVTGHRVLPLLDGLDELASDRQLRCALKINEFLHEWMGDLIVCSRIEEYQRYEALLSLQSSIVLQPLRREQIRNYVRNESLWQSIESDSNLQELAQIPLMLNVMVVASVKLDVQQWKQLASSQERLDYLFEAYINTVSGQPRCKDPSLKQTRRWLGWLAIQLIREKETEFFIEKIQPYWLKYKIQKVILYLIYRLVFEIHPYWLKYKILKVIFHLIYGVIFGLMYGLIIWRIFGLKYGLIAWFICGLMGGYAVETIQTVETLKWDLKTAKQGLIKGVTGGPIVGLICGLIFQQTFGPIVEMVYGPIIRGIFQPIDGPIGGMIFGFITGLIYGPILLPLRGFAGPEIKNKTVPNQGIRQSFVNTIPLSAIFYLPLVSLSFILREILGLNIGWHALFINSLGIALVFSIAENSAFIEHFVLRLMLWLNGYAPWNYTKFLDYATNRLLMQRVGGGYRFLHDLLRQHFAKHYG